MSFDEHATVTANLTGVAAGTSLKVYFDLLGLGAKGSRIVIDDGRFRYAPNANLSGTDQVA